MFLSFFRKKTVDNERNIENKMKSTVKNDDELKYTIYGEKHNQTGLMKYVQLLIYRFYSYNKGSRKTEYFGRIECSL